MAEVHLTSHLRNIVAGGPFAAAGATVGEALADVLNAQPQLRSYVLDDQGGLRKHVCIFADGVRLNHAAALDHRIGPQTKLHVMQALSGG